jgi:transcriptional regulator with XRE-family HTH domain
MPNEVAQEIKQRWGTAVKLRRKEQGLLQEQLAELAGVDQGTVSNLETGRHLPSIETRIAIAKALDTTHDSLFSVDEVVA